MKYLKEYKIFDSVSIDNPYIYNNPLFVKMIESAIEPSSFICTFVTSLLNVLLSL